MADERGYDANSGMSATLPTGFSSGSIPATVAPISRHNVVLAGLRRSGKSSILNVVYQHMSASDTLFLESHSTGVKGRWTTLEVDGFLPLRIWDGPGPVFGSSSMTNGENSGGSPTLDAAGTQSIAAEIKEGKLKWQDVGAVIFVIDAQDDYFDCITKLHELILHSFAINPFIEYHVFVHKVDGLSDDYKLDTQRDLEQRLLDELADSSTSFAFTPAAAEELNRRRAAEATGRATGDVPGTVQSTAGGFGGAQSLAQSVGTLLLGTTPGLNGGASGTTSASLTGGRSGNGIGGASPSGQGFFPLESNVKLHFHLTSIFDNSIFVAVSRVQQSLLDANLGASLEAACDSICGSCRFDKALLIDVASRTYIASDSTPFEPSSFDMVCEYVNFLLLFSDVYRDLRSSDAASSFPLNGSTSNEGQRKEGSFPLNGSTSNEGQRKEGKYASSNCRLHPDTSISFWQIDDRMALIAILKSEVQARNAGLIDYNVTFFRKAIVQVAQVVKNS